MELNGERLDSGFARDDLGGAQRFRDIEGLHRRLRIARAHRRRCLHGSGGDEDRPGQCPLQGQPEDDRRRPAERLHHGLRRARRRRRLRQGLGRREADGRRRGDDEARLQRPRYGGRQDCADRLAPDRRRRGQDHRRFLQGFRGAARRHAGSRSKAPRRPRLPCRGGRQLRPERWAGCWPRSSRWSRFTSSCVEPGDAPASRSAGRASAHALDVGVAVGRSAAALRIP